MHVVNLGAFILKDRWKKLNNLTGYANDIVLPTSLCDPASGKASLSARATNSTLRESEEYDLNLT